MFWTYLQCLLQWNIVFDSMFFLWWFLMNKFGTISAYKNRVAYINMARWTPQIKISFLNKYIYPQLCRPSKHAVFIINDLPDCILHANQQNICQHRWNLCNFNRQIHSFVAFALTRVLSLQLNQCLNAFYSSEAIQHYKAVLSWEKLLRTFQLHDFPFFRLLACCER